jgi:hypothetical protein
MSASASPAINETKLHEFVMKAVGEMGAAMNAARIVQSNGRHGTDDVRRIGRKNTDD